MNQKIFALLVILLIGCGTNPSPTPTVLVAPRPTREPATPTEIAAPTGVPTPVTMTNEDLLRILPLKEGAQWIYVQDAYETIPNDALPERTDRSITATVMLTDTVVETQTHEEFYAARVVRETEIVATSLPLESLGENGKTYFASTEPDAKWYVFGRNRIWIATESLDWGALDQSFLAYRFPLNTFDCWYPQSERHNECDKDSPMEPEARTVQRVQPEHVPAGVFQNCYAIYDIYTSGPLIQRLCEGVGIVREDYDHSGTPFGSHSQLVEFKAGR